MLGKDVDIAQVGEGDVVCYEASEPYLSGSTSRRIVSVGRLVGFGRLRGVVETEAVGGGEHSLEVSIGEFATPVELRRGEGVVDGGEGEQVPVGGK